MSDQWFYGENNQQHGPVSLAAIRDRVAAGLTRADDLIWREGMPNWTPAGQVPEVSDAVPRQYAGGYDPQQTYQAQQQSMAYYHPNDALAGAEFVGFWWRVLASIIDGFVTGIVGALIGGVLGAILGMTMGNDQQAMLIIQLVAQVAGIIINWLYSAIMESSAQQATLGKMAIGVRVVDANGARLSFGRATGRFFAKYFISSLFTLGIGLMMAGWTRRKQGLHDLIAGTFVVRGRPGVEQRGFQVGYQGQ